MGCDIHMYVEYKKPNNKGWRSFGSRINPGRHYYIFGLLSLGVRSDNPDGVEPRGLPHDLGNHSHGDAFLIINDEYSETDGFCSKEQAERWQCENNKIFSDGHLSKIGHPDWHSHSYLSIGEFEGQLRRYTNHPEQPEPPVEYEAILGAMKRMEELGYMARVVFWFDN